MSETLSEERKLSPLDDQHAATTFQYDGNVLGSLTESMVPRFFGALTDTTKLPSKSFKLDELTAMQNRVNSSKVNAIRASMDKSGKMPLVVSLNGKLYIADGHHRATAAWLAGEETIDAHYKDLDEETNAVKSADIEPIEIIKVDEEHRVVYGWANVITEKGQPVIDTQGDVIDAHELLNATTEYMKGARIAKLNHSGGQIGEVLHSFPMTFDIAKSLGIETNGREGWITGMFIHKDDIWERVKKRELKSFSIGARAVRVPI
jgi:hypothetical protein